MRVQKIVHNRIEMDLGKEKKDNVKKIYNVH